MFDPVHSLFDAVFSLPIFRVWYCISIAYKSFLILYILRLMLCFYCLYFVFDTVYQSPISGVDAVYSSFDAVLSLAVCRDLMLFVHYLLVMFGAMYLLPSFKSVRCYVFYAVWCHELFAFKSRFMFLCGLTFAGCHPSLHPVIVVFVFTLYKWI